MVAARQIIHTFRHNSFKRFYDFNISKPHNTNAVTRHEIHSPFEKACAERSRSKGYRGISFFRKIPQPPLPKALPGFQWGHTA